MSLFIAFSLKYCANVLLKVSSFFNSIRDSKVFPTPITGITVRNATYSNTVFCLLLPLHFRCFITNLLFSTGNNGYISFKSLYILSGPDKTTIYFFNSGCRLIYARFIFLEPESCLFTINYVIELS